MKESKYDDSIMMIDTSLMSPVDVVFYEEKKATIRLKRSGQ